jgi:LCP family protein required for cell wall assembly
MWKRFLLGSVLIVLLAAAVTATASFEEVKKVATFIGQGPQIKAPGVLTPDQAGAPQTIMIIGSDKRALAKSTLDRTDPPHTDTMMLLRMDPSKGQTSVLSIPRDLQVSFSDQRGGYYPGAKINSAYTQGYLAAHNAKDAQTAGAKLAAKVVKQTLGIDINHVIDVNFAGFRAVVDAVNCVYVDVDRHYYNVNLGTAATNYSSINIQPGYQKLCGQPALDYVRYRHTDSDFVRVARQQDFIRQLKQQIGVNGLIDKSDQILKAIGPAITTDIRGSREVIRLTKLVAFSVGRPVRQVKFQSSLLNLKSGAFVVATPDQIHRTVDDFLNGNETPKLNTAPPTPSRTRGRRGRRAVASGSVPGLVAATSAGRDAALSASVNSPLPIYYPGQVLASGAMETMHPYSLRDEQGRLHRAYRIVFSTGLIGSYWGVEGMRWKNPPILDHPNETRTVHGRTLLIFNDGQHIHLIAWQTAHAVYWISNTLLEDLNNRQMLAIAESAQPLH